MAEKAVGFAATPASCLVCDGDQLEPLYAGLLKCRRCAFVTADVSLSDAELAQLYGPGYFSWGEYHDYLGDQDVLRRNFRLRFDALRPLLDPARHRRLLEIGCGYGLFLDVVRDAFTHVEGVDVADEATRYARRELGLDVRHGDFLESSFDAHPFDVVCLWDTIEHLGRPDRYLEKIQALTLPGALVAITTGDIASINARVRRGRWRLIHPPTHLHYFSRRTLTRLLDRFGFDVIYCRYSGSWRSTRFATHSVLVLRHGWKRLFEALDRSAAARFPFYLNMFDIMYVIARRRR